MQDQALRKAFGARVKSLRKQRHWSQKELAAKVAIRFQLLNKYEGGQHMPSVELLLRLADALDTTVDYLLTGNSAQGSPLASIPLLKRFQALEVMSEADRALVIEIVDAVIAKRQADSAIKPL